MSEQTIMPPFRVTQAAVDAIIELGGVRLDLEEGGCCGTAYSFSLTDPDHQAAPGEVRYGCPGGWLVVTEQASSVLTGAILDYGARLKPPRFRITRNPNVEHVCACRRSFGREWPGPGQPTCRSYLPMPWDHDFQPPARWRRQTGYDERS